MRLTNIFAATAVAFTLFGASAPAQQQPACQVPRDLRNVWHCERGMLVGPEGVILNLPIAATDSEALYNAGIEAAGREDWRVAIAYFTAAHQNAHLVPRYMYNLGLAHARAGHEVAAIAWLTTYLIAAPDASNRAAIWQQIGELEASHAAKVDDIYTAAETAIAQLPANAVESGEPRGVRSRAYWMLSYDAAQARDYARASNYRNLSLRAALQPPTEEDLNIEETMVAAALEDGDLPYAVRSGRTLNSPFVQRLRLGYTSQDLCRSIYLSSGDNYRNSLCPYPRYQNVADRQDYPIYMAIQSGDRQRLQNELAFLRSQPRNYGWDNTYFAINGQAREVLATISGSTEQHLMQSARSEYASRVANAILRTGSAAEAEPWVRALEQFNGSAPVFRALSMAEQGQTEEAVYLLGVHLSRSLVPSDTVFVPSEANSPQGDWYAMHFDGRVMIAEFLVDRGRRDQAIQVMSRLDSLRQRLLATYALQTNGSDSAYAEVERAALARATEGGPAIDPARQRLVEDAIVVATTIPSIGYDPAWWFRATERSQLSGSRNARIRAMLLGIGAESLQRGLIRVKANYARSGGVWGQDAPIDLTAAAPLITDACPRNMMHYRGTQTTLTCRCVGPIGIAGNWVYGSGPYSDDSNICYAAVHAGAITNAGGMVAATTAPGQSRYPYGGTRNGAYAGEAEAWGGSFTVAAAPP